MFFFVQIDFSSIIDYAKTIIKDNGLDKSKFNGFADWPFFVCIFIYIISLMVCRTSDHNE